ncbi:hypothetical protein V2J09_005241 [Rumex salicifolius]
MTSTLLLAAAAVLLLLPLAAQGIISSVGRWESILRMPSADPEAKKPATTWALLVAGSNGYGNYRHQADVCHAYQILKKGGLKEKNIVVFMYDDIATNVLNPRPGVIINHPQGKNVYEGVPKDYTGENVTAQNLYAVILGDKNGLKGMPNLPFIYAKDFIETLKKKHEANAYKKMVLYIEACESGSIFEGMMPEEDLRIYVTTASNAQESSWGTYCPGMEPSPPPEYITCLADLYSVAWMEDSETHNLKKETLEQQHQIVKDRTSNFNTYTAGSHVMEYGNKSLKTEKVYLYQGYDPATKNFPPNSSSNNMHLDDKLRSSSGVVNQRDADLLFLWQQYKRAAHGSKERGQAWKEIRDRTKHRVHLDTSIQLIGSLLFGGQNGPSILNRVRSQGEGGLVDDWGCLKSMVRVFEEKCGSLTQYGMKHMRALANICNHGVSLPAMEEACATACNSITTTTTWRPHPSNHGGYSA